jgi:hypothetical protein
MSSRISSRLAEPVDPAESAGVARSEPGGRAQCRAGAERPPGPRPELANEVKALLPDEVSTSCWPAQAARKGSPVPAACFRS